MSGSKSSYIPHFFNINIIHNHCLKELKNQVNCTAFSAACAFYKLCSGGINLYNSQSIEDLSKARLNNQISIPNNLQGVPKPQLAQEITNLFFFQINASSLRDKSLAFQALLQKNIPKKKASKTIPPSRNQNKRKKSKQSTVNPMIFVFGGVLFIAAITLIIVLANSSKNKEEVNLATHISEPAKKTIMIKKAYSDKYATQATTSSKTPTIHKDKGG